MSYVVHVWVSPVPSDPEDAWAIVQQLHSQRGSTPPALVRFVERMTARYPDWADLPDELLDDDHQVWAEPRLRADGPLLVLGICPAWVDRAQPFVVQEANRLGLVCFDMQLGQVYKPTGHEQAGGPGKRDTQD